MQDNKTNQQTEVKEMGREITRKLQEITRRKKNPIKFTTTDLELP